ncbi:hypothetical protein BOX15_Mlig007966g1, partial [Macrostomum lignano]
IICTLILAFKIINKMDTSSKSNAANFPIRSQEDLIGLMSMAKISTSEVQPVVQSVHFANELLDDQVMLLELDEALLAKLIKGEDRLEVKGSIDQEAVLCTSECTYEVREVETSNSLMLSTDTLMPPATASAEGLDGGGIQVRRSSIAAVKHSYAELRRLKPGPASLRCLLPQSASYRGLVEEQEADADAAAAVAAESPTMEQLRTTAQMSDSELSRLLDSVNAIELDGRVRLLHEDLPQQVLSALMSAAVENDWTLAALPVEDACASLADLYDPRVTRRVIQLHSVQSGVLGDCVELDSKLISRTFGHFLLRLGSAYDLSVFLPLWQEAVSDAATVSLDHLAGLCLTSSSPGDCSESADSITVRYFPADLLPDNHAARFAELFKARAKWTLEDLQPYLESVCYGKVTPGSLLARYARVSNANGRKYYSAR